MSHNPQLVIVAAVGLFSSAQAGTIYVDDDNCPGPGSGTLGDPYCSIQTAIFDAVDTDAIVVAPGTYCETVDFLGKAITLRSSDGPDVTTIDAGGVGAGSVVTCASGEGPGSVLQGLTITGGFAIAGGGMYNDGTSPTVIGCVFSNNSGSDFVNGRGGGMYNENASPTVIGCTFSRNGASGANSGSGGGMYNNDSSPTVMSCTFTENVAPFIFSAGGGMYNENSSPVIVNCLFHANVSPTGGGMANDNSNPIVTNCTFTGNSLGGVYNYSSDPVLTNCVLWANFDIDPIVEASSSSSTVSYSDVQGGWRGAGSNNIDADPLFVTTSNCCGSHFDTGCDDPICELEVCDIEPLCCDDSWYFPCVDLAATLCSTCPSDNRLLPGSPCIDAGDNGAVPEGIDTDLDGSPRFLDVPETPDTGNPPDGGPLVDMGAYESLGGGCVALTSQQVVCHPDGSTFTLNVDGVSACTGDTVMTTFTGSGGAVGEQLCFTMMVNGDQGGFCCSTQVCVAIPDCSQALADLNGDGFVGVLDLMVLLSQLGPCNGSCWADMDHDGMVGVTDLLIVLRNWD